MKAASSEQGGGRAGAASPGRIWPSGPADTWRERAGVPRMFAAPRPRRFTHTPSLPHALPFALKSRGSGLGAGRQGLQPGRFYYSHHVLTAATLRGMKAVKEVLGDLPTTQGEALTSTPSRRRRGRKHTETGVGAWGPAVQAQRPLGYLPFPSSASFQKPCLGCGIRWTLIQTPPLPLSSFGLW